MRKPTVILDCDGVLCDFITPTLRLASAIVGREILIGHLDQWDFFPLLGGKKNEQELARLIKKEGFCASLEPYPGAQEAVGGLRARAEVVIATSPWVTSKHWMSERTEWLKTYFEIHPTKVVHISQKGLLRGDFFVDDKPDHVVEWASSNPNGQSFLWSQPYNQYHQVIQKLAETGSCSQTPHHTNSWLDVQAHVKELARQLGV